VVIKGLSGRLCRGFAEAAGNVYADQLHFVDVLFCKEVSDNYQLFNSENVINVT
jgi:hypothetical protein